MNFEGRLGRHDELGPPVGRIRAPPNVAELLELVARFHAPIFRTIFKESRLECASPRIRFIRPDVAAVDVQWTMTGARDPQGHPWPERRPLMNLIMTPDEGSWRIAVMHNMDLQAPDLRDAQQRLQESA